MKRLKILIIPDAYLKDYSGAGVAIIARELLLEMGHEVAVFTHETKTKFKEKDDVIIYPRLFSGMKSQFIESDYERNYIEILDEYRPDVIFIIGSVTNKPVCYLRIARKRGIKIICKIFMQDFFCTKYYANDEHGLCTRCLDKSFYSVLFSNCQSQKKTPKSILKNVIAATLRKKMKKELVKADAVITSSKQQLNFYVRYGIPKEKCYITPLYFNGSKLKNFKSSRGNYYVFVAQNRIDKGIHLLKHILSECSSDVKVIAAYTSQDRIAEAINQFGLQPYVDNGKLEMRANCTWKSDLGNVISDSLGVINPSIWPTTTEYVLLETLGLKKPIFTFNVGIHSEIIQTGVNGFVAETPMQMARQMNEFIERPELYDTISANAYTLYLKLTDRDSWKMTISNIFNNIGIY